MSNGFSDSHRPDYIGRVFTLFVGSLLTVIVSLATSILSDIRQSIQKQDDSVRQMAVELAEVRARLDSLEERLARMEEANNTRLGGMR